jgi:uncharacterized protein
VRFIDVSGIRSRFDEPLITRDGARLSIDIYLPAAEGRYPGLITRTPYDNNRMKRTVGKTALLPSPADRFKKLAAHGFAVVACDVRGRGDSAGSFVPFAHEAQDGADTVEWARRLPECDGHVGTFGNGYAGFTALAAAAENPVDAVMACSPFGADGTPFRGGALRLDWLFWMHLVGGRTVQPVDVPAWEEIFRHRPLISLDEALGRDDVWWRDWLEDGSHRQALDLTCRLTALEAPTLLVTGWWDAALTTTARYWDALGNGRHALVVGPWDTETVREPRTDVGGIAWGPSALLDPDELLISWFSAHLKGEGAASEHARVFLTGRNEWTTVEGLDSAKEQISVWLASGGRANTRRGDGRLASSPPDNAAADRFTHNPENPVRWQPANESFSRSAPRLTLDTAFATSRDDVLVYDAEPVTSSIVIRGRAVATLWVHSDALDADWIVAIEDVFPGGGRSVHLAHGIRRAGVDGMQPPQPIERAIELTPIAHELLPGHRLRLLVSSSLWPLYAVNFGGADYLHDTAPRISEHALFHGRRFPSRLHLPLGS